MMNEYNQTMKEVLLSISKHHFICFTLDGATNLQWKQILNIMMAYVPNSFFLEHFTKQLRRESATNLLEKLPDCKLQLLGSVCAPAPGYSMSRERLVIDNGDIYSIIGNHDAEPLVCSKKEHFLNPPMFTFCSVSPSIMQKMQMDCLALKEFMLVYGCAPHAIHNSCMDLIKHFPGLTVVLKQVLFMVKTLKSSHLLVQLLNKLCLEKYKKTYTLILFTKTQWGSVYYAAQQESAVKAARALFPGEIMNANLDIGISDRLKTLVTDPA